jgi:NADPH:quinone reductase-like Zn-dependent oxidoreductase
MKKLSVQLNGGKAYIPGADFAGIIHSAGKNSRWTVGQEVHGMNLDTAAGEPLSLELLL